MQAANFLIKAGYDRKKSFADYEHFGAPSKVSSMPPQFVVTIAFENTVGHVATETFVSDIVCVPPGPIVTVANPVE